MVLEQIVAHQAILVLPLASIILVLLGLEIMAPLWVISATPAHLIPSLTLEKSMV
jgi:hypothetical protein